MEKIEITDKMDTKYIYLLKQNQINLFKNNKLSNIVGIFTEGLATCCSIIISFDYDKFVLFSHFDEDYDILSEIKNNFDKTLKKEKIEQINIFYSKSIGPIFNKRIKHQQILNGLKNLLNDKNRNLKYNIFIKEHKIPISYLKIIFQDNKQYFNNIIDETLKRLNNFKFNISNESFKESKFNNFMKEKNDVYYEFNISYNFMQKMLEKIIKKFNIKFKSLDN